MARKKFYYDLHVHTARYSPCSNIPPEELIARAKACRLDGLALTEHDRRWTQQEIEQLRAEAGDGDFTILAGVEVRTMSGDRSTGDLLIFGPVSLPDRPCNIDEVCRLAHRQGGIVIAPHPYAEMQGIGLETPNSAIDALEIWNYRYRSREAEKMAERACREGRLIGVASSDAHALEEVGRFCTEFDEPVHSETELIEAILDGRCRPRRAYPPSWFGRLF